MYSAREFGIKVERSSGVEEYCLCPFHTDHTPSASFNRVKGLLYCYVCGKGWNVAQLTELLKVEFAERECDIADLDLLGEEGLFELGEDRPSADYFAKRGISPEVIRTYGVRWREGEPRAAVLPIRNLQKNVVGVAYRYLEGATRYKVFGRPTPIWPMPLLQGLRGGQPVLVFEGAWSAMRIASVAGVEAPAFALLGAKASPSIMDVLRPFQPVFLYDGDQAGERACRKMRTLSPFSHSWTVPISPDDMDDDQIRTLLGKLRRRGVLGL